MSESTFNPHHNAKAAGSQRVAAVQVFDSTGTAVDSFGATAASVGSAVPATGSYTAINVSGTLRGLTGVNPSGSVYAAQVDLASVAGTTTKTGAGTASGAIRVELPTDGTGVIATVTAVTSITNSVTVAQATATNLKTQAECYQDGSAVAAGNPLQVSLANTGANGTAVKVNVASGGIASGAIASGAIASGAIASGAVASGAFASGSIASGAIAAGAIAVGATSIADNEDVASAGADTLVKVAQIRQDTPVANASVSNDGDYTQFRADNFGKTWVTATVNEDVAHIAAEPITASGSRRIDPCASSAGSDGDWATVNQSAEGALWVTTTPTTASGLSVANFTSGDSFTALTNSAQAIKASAGNLYGWYMYNPNAAISYVMVYNVASGSVTVGTTNPTLVFCLPANGGANAMLPFPITFSNAGWSCAAATTGGGNSAPSTALEVMFFYK